MLRRNGKKVVERCWVVGLLVNSFIGLLVYWVIRLQVYWVVGLLVYWFIGLLVYWFIGLLGYWVIGFVGCCIPTGCQLGEDVFFTDMSSLTGCNTELKL